VPIFEALLNPKASVEEIKEMRGQINRMTHTQVGNTFLGISFEFEEIIYEGTKIKSENKRNSNQNS